MKSRAIVRYASNIDPTVAFDAALEQLSAALKTIEPTILRADWIVDAESMTWADFNALVGKIRRNYFKCGVATPDFAVAFTPFELNSNLMLYPDKGENGKFNADNANAYSRIRFGTDFPTLKPDAPVVIFKTAGAFVIDGDEPRSINDSGHREVSHLDSELISRIARNGAQHLARQVLDSGKFIYGRLPCFDKILSSYNSLRHFSSTFAMLDVYETYDERSAQSEALRRAIIRSIDYGVKNFVRWRQLPDGSQAAYIEEPSSKEFKLGALGISIVALAKFTDLMRTQKYLPLMNALARGIYSMQNDDGSFVHVLNSTDYTVKEPFRIVYYDGEATFGMMRLYSFTRDERLLEASKRAFDRFIATDHWKNHDHWLSYAVNELTRYEPRAEYFEFGINNFLGHLRFIRNRETQFPTLMELMMAADTMLERMKSMPEMSELLSRVDFDKFYEALEARAANMLNGYFYPETAMFFARPESIVGSFFMRHHAFRVRNDDVEHFLSGFANYRRYLARRGSTVEDKIEEKFPEKKVESAVEEKISEEKIESAEIFFAGDLVVARRMHWRVNECRQFGNIPAMTDADLRIVNLESVISTVGEQGVEKGEGGPYYYHARPEMTNVLTNAHIDVALTANNHCGDYGPDAVLEQLNYLDRAGIIHVGSGKNLDEASAPVYVKVKNLVVAIFSVDSITKYFAADDNRAGTWFLPLDEPDQWHAAFADRIAEAHRHADLVVVAPHWGVIESKAPVEAQKIIGHLLIDLGADAVLGCHSHQIQGIEKYNERPIIYDAGNFLFDLGIARDAGGFSLTVARDGVKRVTFTPLLSCNGYVKAADDAGARINNRFVEMCLELGTEAAVNSDGTVAINFLPPARPSLPIPHSAFLIPNYPVIDPLKLEHHTIEPLSEPRPEWTVERVPDDAVIGSRALGPLLMVGYRVPPECRSMSTRRMLYVETYWKLARPFNGNCRLLIVARPTRECSMPSYGAGMEHDFCDWQFPTERWREGVIYRERFGLRPPERRRIANVRLQIEIRLKVNDTWFGSFKDPHLIELSLPHVPHYRTSFPDIIYRSKPGQCWSAEQIRQVTGGRWLVVPPDGWFVNAVARGVKHLDALPKPAMYVVSTGDKLNFHEGSNRSRMDTHGLLKNLTSKTAGAIVERLVEGLPPKYPQLLVEDPIKALIELGLAARRRFQGKVIAITGTVGKSSVSAMLECALQHKKCIATFENYNSRVGVPIMLASLPQDYDYAIIEVAMSALWMFRGPITYDINPDISIITRIGMSQTAHTAVNSLDDIIKVKAKVFQGLTEDGVAIFPDNLEGIDYVDEQAKKYAARQILCGSGDKATSKILEIKDVGNGHDVRAEIEGEEVRFSVSPYGMASVMNMMLVLATVKAAGENLNDAIERLSHYQAPYGRIESTDAEFDGKNIRVIDDSWNAEVLSFERALKAAPHMMKAGGRLIGVLGRIVNLGTLAKELHQGMRDMIVETKFDYIVTHGDEMMYLREVLPTENLGPHFSDAPSLIEHLKTILRDDDTILIKGSRRDSDFGTIGLILIGQKP